MCGWHAPLNLMEMSMGFSDFLLKTKTKTRSESQKQAEPTVLERTFPGSRGSSLFSVTPGEGFLREVDPVGLFSEYPTNGMRDMIVARAPIKGERGSFIELKLNYMRPSVAKQSGRVMGVQVRPGYRLLSLVARDGKYLAGQGYSSIRVLKEGAYSEANFHSLLDDVAAKAPVYLSKMLDAHNEQVGPKLAGVLDLSKIEVESRPKYRKTYRF